MNILDGINSFLHFINENWTGIMVCIGLLVGIYVKAKDYISKSNEEKVEVAKTYIRESILKMITDAEIDFEAWDKAGSIKRSQVIQEIYASYPILEKVVDQQAIIDWIDEEIDNALKTLREIITTNESLSLESDTE